MQSASTRAFIAPAEFQAYWQAPCAIRRAEMQVSRNCLPLWTLLITSLILLTGFK